MRNETGPIYNVPLIDTLPLGKNGMTQQMPCRDDLVEAIRRHERVVAGYEVLLSKYRKALFLLSGLADQFRSREATEGNEPIQCSRPYFKGLAEDLEAIIQESGMTDAALAAREGGMSTRLAPT